MAFNYESRKLPFTFTSPSGATFDLQYDRLEREGGKKASTNEVLDSDVSVTQDQGNNADRYPVDVYFTGDDYDLIADGFWAALSERYSVLNPGIIVHPRWGPIEVIPIKFKQSESFVDGKRRANFSVDFIRVYPFGGIFETVTLVVSQVVGLVTVLKSGALTELILNTIENIQAIVPALRESVLSVTTGLKDLLSLNTDSLDKIKKIELDSDDLLSNADADNIKLVIGQIFELLDIPSQLTDITSSKNNAYTSIIEDLINDNFNGGDISKEVKKNKAIMMERLTGYAVASQCVGALTTEYSTRAQTIKAIDVINASYESFNNALESASVNSSIKTAFSGSYDFLSTLDEIVRTSTAILLNKSFESPIEKSIVLKGQSDPVTLCYEYYGKVDNETIQFFLESNNISGNEFLELQSGREIFIYG